MTEKNRKRPIDISRDSAKSIEIGVDGDDTPITGYILFAQRMLTVKGGGIYEVQLADQLDPNRKTPKMPDTQRRLIQYGSDTEFMSRSLLTGDILINEMYMRPGVSRDRLMPIVLNFASNLAQINDLIVDYIARETIAVEELDRANRQMKAKGSFTIPDVLNVDSVCKDFFLQSKRALQDLLTLSKEFFGDELKRGYFSNLQDLARLKYGEDDIFHQFLKEANPFLEFMRVARNCIEHEQPKRRAIISNFRMNESAEIIIPRFELIHPQYPQDEVDVRFLLETVFSNLVEFSETLLGHLVDKNINNSDAGFVHRLMYFPEGKVSNPNIRYGFGVMLDGELRPIG